MSNCLRTSVVMQYSVRIPSCIDARTAPRENRVVCVKSVLSMETTKQGISIVPKTQGHSYKRYFSNCGGCCDCGDCESWVREGWCDKHRNASYHKDSDMLMDPEQGQCSVELTYAGIAQEQWILCGLFALQSQPVLIQSKIPTNKNWYIFDWRAFPLIASLLNSPILSGTLPTITREHFISSHAVSRRVISERK